MHGPTILWRLIICGTLAANVQSFGPHHVADSRTNDSDKTHGPGLLDFEFAVDEDNMHRAPVFSVSPDPDDTWAKVWKGVPTALAHRGHTSKMTSKKQRE